MSTLYDKLTDYSRSDYYGFHMPGHKRNLELRGALPACRIDITEIEGFDDLHHSDGILKEAQELAASVYHADETHFLVGGSTSGILSAVFGTVNKGDKILVARNCHKSVYHAIYMHELEPVYLYPEFDEEFCLNTEVKAEDVKKALEEHPQIRAVIIVSPTYDGVVSDIEAVAAAVHEKGLLLIVDEAHGAHLGFHSYFPENSNVKGADIVIHSVHKTLPALTQTALLHMNGSLVNRERVRRYLHMLQSSSPSYVLMASIDSCVHVLDEGCAELFDPYVGMLESTRNSLSGLKRLRLLSRAEGYDRSKIVISTKDSDIGGRELYWQLLERYSLQMEMMAGSYVLAMTSVGDREEGFERLVKALFEIDKEIDRRLCGTDRRVGEDTPDRRKRAGRNVWSGLRLPRIYGSAQIEKVIEAEAGKVVRVPWKESAGSVSLEYAYLYPPGTPLIVPGEQITDNAAELLCWYDENGYSVEGLKSKGYIEVWLHG